MKDENKICFNKTLTYLVLLVAAVVGAFYVMNYANEKKITTNTEATSSFYTASAQCKSEEQNTNEKAWCIPGGSFNTIKAALDYVELKTGIKYSNKVRITSKKCTIVKYVLEGKCIVFTKKTTEVDTTTNPVPPVINQSDNNPTFTPTKCSTYGLTDLPAGTKTKLKNYCLNKYGVKYGTGTGDRSSGLRGSRTGTGCYSLMTKTCATAPNCETEDCLRCINDRVYNSNCPVVAPKCDPQATGIKAVVTQLKTAIASDDDGYKKNRIDAARRKLLNYYALRTTTGYDPAAPKNQNPGGCVLSLSKFSKLCNDKTVSQDYCSCATWSRTQDVVDEDCKNVINWVDAGTYDKAP